MHPVKSVDQHFMVHTKLLIFWFNNMFKNKVLLKYLSFCELNKLLYKLAPLAHILQLCLYIFFHFNYLHSPRLKITKFCTFRQANICCKRSHKTEGRRSDRVRFTHKHMHLRWAHTKHKLLNTYMLHVKK